MSREFSKISPKVWRSKRFVSLPNDDARFLMIFLLTSPHQSSAGCFRMPDAYAAADVGWDIKRMIKARDHLVAAGLIVFDGATDEYFVAGWFTHNKPMNVSHQTSIVRQISELESDPVREAAEAEFDGARLPSTRGQPSVNDRLANTSFMNGAGFR